MKLLYILVVFIPMVLLTGPFLPEGATMQEFALGMVCMFISISIANINLSN